MAEMSMNKVIHNAVRRDLTRFQRALGGFRDGDAERATQLQTAWTNFDAQLTEHHESEHDIAWPSLQELGVPAPTITVLDQEHEQMATDLAAARAAMHTFATSASKADADQAAAAVATLETTTTDHLDHEERETEQLLLEKTAAGDPIIKRMSGQFRKRVSAPEAGVYFAWLQDGATADDKAALRHSVPGPVLAVLTNVLGRRYRKEVAPVWTT